MKEKMILDMAIGDGYISKPRTINANSSLVLKHSAKQTDYLLYKKSLLESEGIKCTLSSYIDQKGYGVVQVFTAKKQFITDLRNKLYPNGKKTLTQEILKDFNAFSLAILFQDDGSRELCKFHRSSKIKYAVKPYINCFIICMHNFSLDEISLLIEKLKHIGIESRIGNRNGNVILISLKESKKRFIDLINPFIHDSMKYKINYPISFHGKI